MRERWNGVIPDTFFEEAEQSLAGIAAGEPARSRLRFLRRRFQRPPGSLDGPFPSAQTQQQHFRPFYLPLSSVFFGIKISFVQCTSRTHGRAAF